jgi:glycosyltransferase involved in cell wall biosynthesis
MRVLHIITGLEPGGAEHQLRLLLKHLPQRCEVVALANPGSVAEAIRADGTPVHVVPMRGNRDMTVLPRLVRLIRSGRFDVVHTHLYRACVYGRLAARLAGVRHVVATEHSLGVGLIEGRRTTAAVRALYLATERLGQRTIAVSGTVADRLQAWGVRRDRIRVIPNGIDAAELRYDPAVRAATRAALGIPADAPVIGAVGRLVPTKRFDLLIRAVAGLPGATLLLAGDGPQRAGLRDLAEELGVADRVVFAGVRPHVRDVLCAMDAFASPSEQETFGLAVLEALANGLPVVYVTCPPLDEQPPAAATADRLPTADRIPAAVRVPPDVDALRDALARELRDTGRRPVPGIVARHDIARLAAEVSETYPHTPMVQLAGSERS